MNFVTFKLCEDPFLLLSQLRSPTAAQGFVYNNYTQEYIKRILIVSKDKATNLLKKRESGCLCNVVYPMMRF